MSKKNLIKSSIIIIIIIFSILFLYNWIIPHNINNTVYIRIKKGETIDDVLYKLNKKSINFSPFFSKLFYKLFPKEINVGDYYLKGNISFIELSNILKQGFINGIKVTIPEGFTFKEIKNRLRVKQLIDPKKFQNLFKDTDFLQKLGIKSNSLEGYLCPDTYYFVKDNTEKEIIRKMYNLLIKKLNNNNLMVKIKRSKYNLKQILTIASLVEWEAKVDKERPIIAQVFLKRLEISKPLESCASILYALDKHKERLSKQDLKIKSPYNTYETYGLPPTPINNPGLKSIKAVLNPTDTEYLYFVSKNNGTHIFSKSYKNHIIAKRKYQSW